MRLRKISTCVSTGVRTVSRAGLGLAVLAPGLRAVVVASVSLDHRTVPSVDLDVVRLAVCRHGEAVGDRAVLVIDPV